MNKTRIEELNPTNGRNSFYRKAMVIYAQNGKFLLSYDTIHCSVDSHGNIHRYSDYKSNTTCSHLKAFLGDYKYRGYWELPIETQPDVVVVY